jgi:glucosyl-dolichyl phosphate glucuronosyltransferase
MVIQISAIICTYNRANYLRKAIQSLSEQSLATDCYEILVVDNRSTDNTKQIVKEEFAHISNLRYLYEPIQGLSQARNSGWQNALGKYVAYLDDDAIASPHWLAKIIEVFETITPQPGAVGGRVNPIWEAPQPSWLDDNYLPYLTIINWTEVATVLENKNHYIAGANMAFPRSILASVGGFQVDLGRKGNNLLSNEELFLTNKIKINGHSIYYHPEIVVEHHVARSRLNQKWFSKRVYWQGISDAFYLLREKTYSNRERYKLIKKEIKKILEKPSNLFALIYLSNLKADFINKCLLVHKIGYIWGLLKAI